MALEFLGKDPNSPNGDSATVWWDTEAREYVLQGYIETNPATLTELGPLPVGEVRIRFPQRMMQFFPEVNGGRADA
ncbi:hypothetical protein GCM10010156_70260 [Planobispora rosea]|uniref:Uncharacterized protein n=1 Tax=Planobispora rosea TaxID=35762 RepID=A0A8J3WHA4_PLARO|nr:hypothetical protein [Planobispora rosea]GGT02354.1 hypothetical protein GCM10010156_70260 [Planobispora rosea]GIH88562.1 hypothetical protein Pro02_69700 [Planobispora rosea]